MHETITFSYHRLKNMILYNGDYAFRSAGMTRDVYGNLLAEGGITGA